MRLFRNFILGLFFGLYIFTLPGTISSYRDSGDLISAAYTLGVAHPPGYPVMTLLGKIFILLVPVGNIAWRLNLLSAISAGLALYFFGAFLERFLSGGFSRKTPITFFSIVGIFFLGSSLCFWRLAQVSEMYALNSLFVSALLFLLFSSPPQQAQRGFLLATFIFGIGLGNHPMLLFFLPVLLGYFWRQKNYSARFIFLSLVFLFLGTSVYLWLPLRSYHNPVIDWGHPTTLERFWRLVTRADYGGLKLHPEESHFNFTVSVIVQQIILYIKSTITYLGLPGALLGLLGIVFLPIGLVVSWLISGPLFVLLSNLPVKNPTTLPILEPHLIMSLLFLIIGLIFVLEKFYLKQKVLVLVVMIFIAGYIFYSGFSQANNRQNFSAYDYGNNILHTVRLNGIIFDPDDPTAFITRYFQTVGKKRPDIKLVVFFRTRWGYEYLTRIYPELFTGAPVFSSSQQFLEHLFKKVSRQFPIYAELASKFGDRLSLPEGLLVRLAAEDKNDRGHYFTDLLDFYVIRFPPQSTDFFTRHILNYYAFSSNNSGVAAMDRKDFSLARKSYLLARIFQPDLVAAVSNLGTLFYHQQELTKAIKYYQLAVAFAPDEPKNVYNLGLAWRASGEIEKARDCFSKITSEKIYYPPAANELGLIYFSQKDYLAAIKIFSELTTRYPDYSDAWYNLALVYQSAGDKEKASHCFVVYQRLLNKRY